MQRNLVDNYFVYSDCSYIVVFDDGSEQEVISKIDGTVSGFKAILRKELNRKIVAVKNVDYTEDRVPSDEYEDYKNEEVRNMNAI